MHNFLKIIVPISVLFISCVNQSHESLAKCNELNKGNEDDLAKIFQKNEIKFLDILYDSNESKIIDAYKNIWFDLYDKNLVQDSIDNKRFEDACRSLDDLPDNVKRSCESFQKFDKRSILNKKIVFPNLLRYRIFRVNEIENLSDACGYEYNYSKVLYLNGLAKINGNIVFLNENAKEDFYCYRLTKSQEEDSFEKEYKEISQKYYLRDLISFYKNNLFSPPTILHISFNNKLTKAIVFLEIKSGHMMHLLYERKNEKWTDSNIEMHNLCGWID